MHMEWGFAMTKTLALGSLLLGALLVGCSSSTRGILNGASASASRTKFRVQEVVDEKQGNLVALRYAVPQDWTAGGRFDWNYNSLYAPLRISTRAQSPD